MNLITTTNGQPMTTSLVIAERFGKRHDTVLRAVRKLECSDDFRLRNFAASSYINEQGKEQPCFNITRDGFSFLAMGFTGKEAAKWKEKFIEAFNAMERALRQQDSYRATVEWQEARQSGKVIRLTTTDVIQEFVGYAKAQGSQSAEKYYLQITKMEYRAIFLIGKAVGEGFRDRLNTMQLLNLATAESIAQRALKDGMNEGLHYKAIYQKAKAQIEQLGNLIGKTLPGERLPRRLAA